MKKTIQLEVPEFVSIQQYADINSYKGTDRLGRLIHAVTKITGKSKEEVKTWSIDSLKSIVDVYADIADHKESFHSIINLFLGKMQL